MKKKKMTVAIALLLAAGGCRSGLEATESLKASETSSTETAKMDSVTETVSEKILSSIHRIEDECAAAIVRFVDGGGEIRVDSAGSATARGVASIEGGRRAYTETESVGHADFEHAESAIGKERTSEEKQSASEETAIEKKNDASQGSIWLSIFFLCLGYFLTGAAIRITKNVKE